MPLHLKNPVLITTINSTIFVRVIPVSRDDQLRLLVIQIARVKQNITVHKYLKFHENTLSKPGSIVFKNHFRVESLLETYHFS